MMIGHNGFWTTVHARRIGLTLVTNNAREFRRVPGFAIQLALNPYLSARSSSIA